MKAPNNNFSRCSECDFLQDCITRYPRGCDEWATFVNDRTKHINYQNACRRLYHGWSSNSVDSPTEFLCIIHDKMDHTKSAIPRMQRSTKATCGLGQIPYLLPGCSRMGTATERMLTTPQHSGPGTQTLLSPPFAGFLEHWNDFL